MAKKARPMQAKILEEEVRGFVIKYYERSISDCGFSIFKDGKCVFQGTAHGYDRARQSGRNAIDDYGLASKS